ncbi:MAG: molybdopterin-dependent oxidoreductase [Bacteroidales bacterium]|nr:molybdopterin-dependent oxidoreductase [Bacteroidales bacterium]
MLGLKTVRVVCPHDCPDTCSMSVTVDTTTQRAVQLRGDREHPFTRGFLCQKVNHYLERVYHPDRLRHPLRRVGPKGEGRFERLSWDAAIAEITNRFWEIAVSAHGPQAILPYSYAGTMGKLHYGSLDRRFFYRLGASLLDRTICSSAGAAGSNVTLGARAVMDPETTVDARYIINWGSNTAVTNMHLWSLMHQARTRGAKIVTVDPHRSRTAARSDWWLPIRPGTDAALALGVAHILFRDGLHDHDYLERYCLGTSELQERVRNEYAPERVAQITGLTVAEIEQFASEYGRARSQFGGPALIRVNYGLQRHGGGGMAVRTICCLPAITGDWRYPGGGALLSTSLTYPFDDAFLQRPNLIRPGTRTVNMIQLAEALHGELPGPPVQALFVYNANPATVAPDQQRVHAGLRRDDLFTVVHDQFLTDTARYADIVLPATTQLEHFDLHGSYGHLYVQVNDPAIPPLAEAKPNTEVFRLLARSMGYEDELFQISDEELARGALRTPGFAGITLERLRAEGPIRLNLPPNWTPFAEGNFGTPSGKCEFFSERERRAGRDPLPHYVPPHEDPQTQPELAARYPLQMVSPPGAAFLNSTFANIDALRQSAGEAVLEIHPSDAAQRGIFTGQLVQVGNDRGRFQARAVVGETVKPGVVATFGTRWACDTVDGYNCNATTSTATADLGGGATFFDNLVEVAVCEEN